MRSDAQARKWGRVNGAGRTRVGAAAAFRGVRAYPCARAGEIARGTGFSRELGLRSTTPRQKAVPTPPRYGYTFGDSWPVRHSNSNRAMARHAQPTLVGRCLTATHGRRAYMVTLQRGRTATHGTL